MEQKEKRNIGIDILRILSMLMIVILHYLGKGEFLTNDRNGIIENCIKSLCIVAVNCYVLISGYFLIESHFTWKKVLKLWGETLFYSVFIYILLIITGLHSFTIKEAIQSFFPIITKEYWFVNVYLLMYILSPFINILIKHLKKEEFKKLIIILLIAFCVMPSVLPQNMNFDTTNGYGIIWFIVLYFIAAYIKLYKKEEQKLEYRYIVIYFILSMIIAASRILIYPIKQTTLMYHYNFILVFLSSLCLFLFFKNIQIKKEKLVKGITYVSSLTFGVYLIHEQGVFRSSVLYNKILHTDLWKDSLQGFLISILLVLGSFIIYLLIEACRQKIWKFIKSKVFRKNV